MSASEGQQPVPPFFPVAPEAGELDQISVAIPDKLYLTNWRAAADEAVLKSLKITHIVAIGAEFVNDSKEGIQYWHKDINDDEGAGQEMSHALRDAASFIQSALKQTKGRCIVHCAAGVSRSATCVLAYKVLHEKVSLYAAFESLIQCRRVVWPNNGFMEALISLEAEVRGKSSITLDDYIAWGDYEGPAAEPDVEILRQSKSLNLDDENEDDAAGSMHGGMSKRHSSLESVSSSSSGGFLKKDREEMARREAATAEAARMGAADR